MKKKIVVMLTGVFAASMLLSGCEASKGLETDNLTITQYKGVEVDEVDKPEEVTDEDVEAAIQANLQTQATTEEVTGRAVESGDTVTIDFTGKIDGMEVDVAAQYNDGYSENVLSFVNNVRTPGGGTHEAGFRNAWTKSFNEFARKIGLLKEKDKNLEGSDVREGLTAVISVRVPEKYLQFEGQTKDKLGTPEARKIVDAVVSEQLGYALMENGEFAQELIKKAIKARQAR